MYYPIQIPYLLSKDFADKVRYSEIPAADYGGFIICFWEMQPLSDQKLSVDNIIVADACIDLVVSWENKNIGFAGMSKTDFNFRLELPARSFGARLMPGAFHQLTELPASAAMDTFLPIESVFTAFDKTRFFALPYEQSQIYFKEFLSKKIQTASPDKFTMLFHTLAETELSTTKELYEMLRLGPRQCQRVFAKRYGITPQMALCIVRFQKCLAMIASGKASPADVMDVAGYYDQPHFINDFKRNIGITPLELVRKYRT